MIDESSPIIMQVTRHGLREEVDALRAERDALRDQWSDLLIEQARLMALRDEAVQQRDDAIAERDALRTEVQRLRGYSPEQAAVLEAATAWADASHPITDNYREYRAAADTLLAAVATLRALGVQP